jgi:hypothetical protein
MTRRSACSTSSPTRRRRDGRPHRDQPGPDQRAGVPHQGAEGPTLRESVPRLAERARKESWTHEEFLAACLQREVAARNPTAAGLTGYGDFGPVQNNLIENNIFYGGNSTVCAYGGSSGDDGSNPYGYLTNARFIGNVFVRGAPGQCGNLGAVMSFDPTRPGNVWSGNTWDSGATIRYTD